MKVLLQIALILTCCSSAHAGDAALDFSKELLGCWKHTTEDRVFMRFEAARVIRFKDGKQSFARADYGPGTVGLWIHGQRFDFPIVQADGKIAFRTDKGTEIYQKLDSVPPELDVKPLPLGKPKALAPARVKEVRAELLKRLEQDQAVRKDVAQRGKMAQVDADNSAYIKKLVQETGWIDVARFGAEPAHAAFLFVQHSGDLPLMLAALPEIESELKSKRITDAQSYALLYDRTKLFLAERQRYGTQVVMNDKKQLLVLASDGAEKIEAARKELGLVPHAEYLNFFKEQNGATEVVYLDE